jgi:hypothetical protein
MSGDVTRELQRELEKQVETLKSENRTLRELIRQQTATAQASAGKIEALGDVIDSFIEKLRDR